MSNYVDYKNYVDLMLPRHYATKKFIPEKSSTKNLTSKNKNDILEVRKDPYETKKK